jgi:hypothetical protein
MIYCIIIEKVKILLENYQELLEQIKFNVYFIFDFLLIYFFKSNDFYNYSPVFPL